MKNEKGITLISLTIYIIAMLIIISIISVISGYFYKNIAYSSQNVDPMVEYTKFNSFFTEEVNILGLEVLECNTQIDNNGNKTSYIVFNNNTQYTYISENKGIYKNKAKISRNIDNCEFKLEQNNGKDTITVNFRSGDFNTTVTYTLKK